MIYDGHTTLKGVQNMSSTLKDVLFILGLKMYKKELTFKILLNNLEKQMNLLANVDYHFDVKQILIVLIQLSLFLC